MDYKDDDNFLISSQEFSDQIIKIKDKLKFKKTNTQKNVKDLISDTSLNRLKKKLYIVRNSNIKLNNGVPLAIYYLVLFLTIDSLAQKENQLDLLQKIISSNPKTNFRAYNIHKLATALRNNQTEVLSEFNNSINIINIYFEIMDKIPIPERIYQDINNNKNRNHKPLSLDEKETILKSIKWENFKQLIMLYPELILFQTYLSDFRITEGLPLTIRAAKIWCDFNVIGLMDLHPYKTSQQIKKALSYIRNKHPLEMLNRIELDHTKNKITTSYSLYKIIDMTTFNKPIEEIYETNKFTIDKFIFKHIHKSIHKQKITDLINELIPNEIKITNLSDLITKFDGDIKIKNCGYLLDIIPYNLSQSDSNYIFKQFNVVLSETFDPKYMPKFDPLIMWAETTTAIKNQDKNTPFL